MHYLNEVSLNEEKELNLHLLDYDKKTAAFLSADVSQGARLLGSNIRATCPSCGYDYPKIRRVFAACIGFSRPYGSQPRKTRYSVPSRAPNRHQAKIVLHTLTAQKGRPSRLLSLTFEANELIPFQLAITISVIVNISKCLFRNRRTLNKKANLKLVGHADTTMHLNALARD